MSLRHDGHVENGRRVARVVLGRFDKIAVGVARILPLQQNQAKPIEGFRRFAAQIQSGVVTRLCAVQPLILQVCIAQPHPALHRLRLQRGVHSELISRGDRVALFEVELSEVESRFSQVLVKLLGSLIGDNRFAVMAGPVIGEPKVVPGAGIAWQQILRDIQLGNRRRVFSLAQQLRTLQQRLGTGRRAAAPQARQNQRQKKRREWNSSRVRLHQASW